MLSKYMKHMNKNEFQKFMNEENQTIQNYLINHML